MALIQCDYCDQFRDPATLHQHRTDANTLLVCEPCREIVIIDAEPHSAAELAERCKRLI